MKIRAAEARAYFWHPAQRIGTATVDDLHDDGFAYYATGGVCLAFHDAGYPGVVMAHVGALPGAWGRAVEPARTILRAMAEEYRPELVIGLIRERNRAALAFARRCGFEQDGRLRLPEPVIVMGWTPWAS